MGGKGRKAYTGFGKALRRMMSDRDIRSWPYLEELIYQSTGRSYSHQSMSKYAAGTSQAPREFVQDFADVLELNQEERMDLARQYTFYSFPEDT